MDMQKLEDLMKRSRVSHMQLQLHLQISKSALYRKLNGISEFKQSEINAIINLLGLNDAEVKRVFFDEKVS